MTGDLMIPILVIILMFIIINKMEEGLQLLLILLLFSGVAILFSHMVAGGAWTMLFGASFVGIDIGVLSSILPNIMFSIPIFCFGRIVNLWIGIRNRPKQEEKLI